MWDYHLDPYDLFEIALGKQPPSGWLTRESVLVRMLERLVWYDLINLFGLEQIANFLTPDLVARIHVPELRDKYDYLRKLLHGEPVPVSGWSPEYRQKIGHTLLSHRWYRTQPGLL